MQKGVKEKNILMAIYALILVNVVQKSKVSIHENDPLSHLNMCTTVIALLTPLVKTIKDWRSDCIFSPKYD